jgi:hypothetical protein
LPFLGPNIINFEPITFVKGYDVVPLRSFLLLTVLGVGLGSPKAKGANGASILQKLLFRSFAIHSKMFSVVRISAIDVAFFKTQKAAV